VTHGHRSSPALERFIDAQSSMHDQALDEIRAGGKQSHWMWFIFPQFEGLGSSETSRYFAIKSRAEAEAYLAHQVLGRRILECAQAVLDVQNRSAVEIFGPVDAMKLRSSATLFAAISPPGSLFHQIIDRYFDGWHDDTTLQLMQASERPQ
jgi:uncharacterized protein (DUF1810 family)